MTEQAYTTIDPATCGGRVEIQCCVNGCEEPSTNVSHGTWSSLQLSVPLCLEHIEETDQEASDE